MRTFTIPGKPVGKGRPRFTRSGRAYTPKSTKDYEKAVKRAYRAKYGDVEPYEGAVLIRIWAFFPIPKSDSKKKRKEKLERKVLPTVIPDLDNIVKCVSDGLNGVAYHDDKQIVSITAHKIYNGEPYVLVSLESFEEEEYNDED